MKSKIVVNFLGSGFRHHQWPLITFFVCVVVDWRTPFTRIKKKGFRSQCGKERRVRIFETIFFPSCHAPSPYCVHVAATHGQKNNNSVGGHACASVCGSLLRTT